MNNHRDDSSTSGKYPRPQHKGAADDGPPLDIPLTYLVSRFRVSFNRNNGHSPLDSLDFKFSSVYVRWLQRPGPLPGAEAVTMQQLTLQAAELTLPTQKALLIALTPPT